MQSNEFQEIALSVAEEVSNKDSAYGSAFDKAALFLSILYPNGVSRENYSDMLTLVRVFDKLMRIATAKDALGENPYRDILGYSLLALRREQHDLVSEIDDELGF